MDKRTKRFLDGMGETLASELLNGGQIIDSFLPDDDKGYVLIRRQTPKKDPKDGWEFWYIMLERYHIKDTPNHFLESVEYGKLSLPTVRKKAAEAFWGKD